MSLTPSPITLTPSPITLTPSPKITTSTNFTPSPKPSLCSKSSRSSFVGTDVSTDPSCICPSGQSQVSKVMGRGTNKQTLFKCEVTKVSTVNTSDSKNIVPGLCSQRPNGSFTSTDVSTDPSCKCPSGQTQVFKEMGRGINKQKFFKCDVSKPNVDNTDFVTSSKICNLTPYNTNNENIWNGFTTDENCKCPDPFVQIKTDVNNTSYYTCS
jgi:hypothetical protein